MHNPQAALVYLRPTRLIYMRAVGSYDRAIPRAWDRLNTWLTENGLVGSIGRRYGVARDNPADVGIDKCRYDACLAVTSQIEDRDIRDLGFATLPGGPYASRRYSGSYDAMRSVIANVYSKFEPLPGLVVDTKRPVVSIYLDEPGERSEHGLRADICIPVTAASGAGNPKTAAVA